MPNRGDRGGLLTRARIADVATGLFLARGFDEVTIADVASAAGVSKVTVFSHFERKEDLLLDRLPDAIDIVCTAIRERADDVDPVTAVRRTAVELATRRHPLSGLSQDAEPFLRTLVGSPALVGRLRELGYLVEAAVAAELEADAHFSGDSALTAGMLVVAYRTVVAASIRRRLAGEELARIARSHRRRLDAAFDAVAHGVSAAADPGPPDRRRV